MSDKPACFVIMPIGKEGSDEFTHFRSVFDVIIKPAAEGAGYRVWRADESLFTGNMTKEIVEALAQSDLVIADLSNRNPNVYLELGIRQCLRRSGTIHLIQADQALPFDISVYRAIKYSTDFDKIDEVRLAIQAAIDRKLEMPEVPDNPVHDALELPQDYRAAAESEQVMQLETAQQQLAEATRELDSLRRQYQGTASENADQADPRFLEERQLAARLTSISSQIRDNSLPGQLIVRAQQARAEGELDELVSITQKLLLSPFTDATEYRTLGSIADQAGLDELKLLVLEQAAAKFPGESDAQVAFAEACVHAADPAIQQRGRQLLETYLHLQWKDGKAFFAKGPIPEGDLRAGVLLDFYHGNERKDEELTLALASLEVYGETPVTLRSLGRAYDDAGDDQEAERYYRRALEKDPTSDTTLSWIGNFYGRRKRWGAARDLHVKACEADPDDPQRVIPLLTMWIMEGRDIGGSKDPNRLQVLENLSALAIARSGGSVGVRAHCARILNVAGYSDISQLCLDRNWPPPEVAKEGEQALARLAESKPSEDGEADPDSV